MEEIVLLEDYMKDGVDKNLVFTIKTYKKSTGRYISTSVNSLSINSPRLKSFITRNGLNHQVMFDVLDGNVLEVYIKTI